MTDMGLFWSLLVYVSAALLCWYVAWPHED